jgi:hypothetical protein
VSFAAPFVDKQHCRRVLLLVVPSDSRPGRRPRYRNAPNSIAPPVRSSSRGARYCCAPEGLTPHAARDISGEKDQGLNQLLVELDGFSERDEIIMIAASNLLEKLDPALLRPGRFDRQIFVTPPDLKERKSRDWSSVTAARGATAASGPPRKSSAQPTGRLRAARAQRRAELAGRLLARLHEPALVGQHDRLDAVAQVQLGQDPRDVGLHGRLAEEEALRDLAVRHATGD